MTCIYLVMYKKKRHELCRCLVLPAHTLTYFVHVSTNVAQADSRGTSHSAVSSFLSTMSGVPSPARRYRKSNGLGFEEICGAVKSRLPQTLLTAKT
jgi:hypothetical protein